MDANHATFPFAPIPANATAAEAVAAYQDRLPRTTARRWA